MIKEAIAEGLRLVIEEAQRIKDSMYATPSTSISQLDQDLESLAKLASNVAEGKY